MNSKYIRRNVNGKNIWVRICPECTSEIFYSTSENTSRAEKKNSMCRKCGGKCLKKNWYKNHPQKPITEDNLTRHCPKCQSKLIYKNKRVLKRANQINRICRSCSRIGRKSGPMSASHRKKISKSHIRRLLNIGTKIRPSYNPRACQFFDRLNTIYGWELKHALNGGEKRILRYFLDSYDKERNIVVEYDESHHYNGNGKLKEEDVLRMKNLIKELNCDFYRYDEKRSVFKKFDKKGLYEEQYEIVHS